MEKESGCGAGGVTPEENIIGSRAEYTPGPRWVRRFFILNILGLAAIAALVWILHAPPQELLLVRIDPQGEAKPLETGSVSVEFGAMLDGNTVGQDAIKLTPSIPGHMEFSNGRILKYVLERPLARATRYRILLSPGLRGLRGERAPERIMEFTTPQLEVRSVTQAGVEGGDTITLAVEFNGDVNPDELRGHLNLHYKDGSPLKYVLAGGKPERRILLHVPQVSQDSVFLTMDKGLAGVEGPLGLAEEYKAELRILTYAESESLPPPPPKGSHIIAITPEVRFLGMEPDQYGENAAIEIKMNTPLDASKAGDYVSIEPEVAHNFVAWGSGLRIAGEFQAGKRYHVTLKKGLPAGAAGELHRDINRAVWFPDKRESMRFAFGGGYLSPQGLLKVPVNTVNIREAELSVSKLYASNVVEHVLTGEWGMSSRHASELATKKLSFDNIPNKSVETLLDLRELAGQEPRGVYGLSLRDGSRYWRRDTAGIVVTDLGLSLRMSETQALCWVTSLSTAKPKAGVEVRLFSNRRQEIGSAVTDTNGLAEIALHKLPADEEAAMVLATSGDDMSYLGFSRNTSSRGKEACRGRAYLQKGYEAFASAERGVYRPGDEVRLSALIRGVGLETPPALPLDMVVNRPDGRELSRKRVLCDITGRVLYTVAIPMSAPSGYYTACVRLPGKKENLGETGFRVADYIPQTLKMELEFPPEPLSARETFMLTARVRHLFGDPARGLKIKGRVRYDTARFAPKGWEGFTFGDERIKGSGQRDSLPEKDLDDAGEAQFEIKAPAISTAAAILMKAEIEVQEAGGRALAEEVTRRLNPWPFYLGLKMPEAAIHPREVAPFDLVAVAPDGKRQAGKVEWSATLYAVSYSNVLRRLEDGRLTYDWTRKEKEESKQRGSFEGGGMQIQIAPQCPGPYRLVIETEKGCAVTRDFYATGAGGSWLAHDPDRVELTLDKPRYKVGTEAVCTLQAPFAGTALVCIENEGVSEKRI
ncbi:MAG: hypothetical protein JXR97_00650, partial [Planctomycetes bacterium]|nr:hypothetical protein [Planctomycetota bacterium]